MPLKLPIKSTPRVKSPAPRTRPSRLSAPSPTRQSSSSQRSRSHDDRDRRPSDSSSSRHAQGSSSGRPRSRHRRSPSPDDRHERRRRRGSSSSPERYNSRRDDRGRRDYKYDGDDDVRRRRRLSAVDARDRDSYAYDDGGRRSRRSSVDHRNPSLRVGAAPGAFNREGENDPRNDDRRRRSSTPDKYKPDKYKAKQRSPSPPPAKPAAAAKPAASPASPPPVAETSSSSSGGASALFNNMPTAIAAYAGLKTLSKQADSAKEWIDWFTELSDTPEEIQELSDKADVARDTIKQVQQLIKARPDLLEGDKQGEALKEQIEDAVDSTNRALGKMTKLLAEISKKGGGSEQGNMMRDFWRSYRYRDEFKDKIEKADVDVQKELTGLSKLMLNLNTRALMKPPSPAVAAAAVGKEASDPAKKDEPKVTETKPEPKPAETKPQPSPVKQGLKEGIREGLVLEGLKKPEEPKDQKEEPAKPAEKPPADIPPKVDEALPKKVEIPSAAVSTPSIVEPGPRLQDKEEAKAAEPEKKAEAVPPSPSAIAREEATIGSTPIGSPPILITEPTKSTASSPSLSREQSSANTAQKRDPSPARDEPEQSPEDALLDAAWDGNLEAAIKALRHVSPRVCDDHGLTPLHLSAERDKMPVSMLLLDRGASISARSDGGRMPLHLAARSATAPMVEMLLERGKADPNAPTSKGRTALHYAASKAVDGDEERREVLRVLRDWGADPTIKDGDGETARDVAQKREHWDAAATLRRAEKKWEEDHKQNWLQRHGFVKK